MANWRKSAAGVQKSAIRVFGTPALYRVGGVDPSTSIRGIFRDEDTSQDVDLEIAEAAVAPVFHVRESDLPAGALDDELDTVELTDPDLAETYRIRDQLPDGEGMTTLLLTLDYQ